MKKLLCFAHRGASGHEPENTLIAIEKAISLGADWMEIDVYAVEGRLVVIHDDRLERTTNGAGYVVEKTFAYLRSLDAGKGQKIPTLQEVTDLVDRRTGVNVELKGRDTAALTVSHIERCIKDQGWDQEQFIVSSFNHRELETARNLAPHLKVGVIIGGTHRRYARFARQHSVYSLHVRMDLVNAGFVERVHRRGLKIFVYTVNNPLDMARLKEMGADGIFTDFPERIFTISPSQAGAIEAHHDAGR